MVSRWSLFEVWSRNGVLGQVGRASSNETYVPSTSGGPTVQSTIDLSCMKKIGFLSFGHWTPSPQSGTQSATDALLQSIDLAVEAERLGMDGAYFRVHAV